MVKVNYTAATSFTYTASRPSNFSATTTARYDISSQWVDGYPINKCHALLVRPDSLRILDENAGFYNGKHRKTIRFKRIVGKQQ